MSRLRKAQNRIFEVGERANSGFPSTVRCPPAPPGFYYTVVNGEYRLVAGRAPAPNFPVGGGSCAPVRYVRDCEPNPFDPTQENCRWVPDIPLGGTRSC